MSVNALRSVVKRMPRLTKTKTSPQGRLSAALMSYDVSLVNSMLETFGFQSSPLAVHLFARHPWLLTDLKCPAFKADLTEKLTLLHDLGIPSTAVLENVELVQVTIGRMMERYQFLIDEGVDPDEISAPLMRAMDKGLEYDEKDRLIEFARKIHPHRANCEYLADSLRVPLHVVHDGVFFSPTLLTHGYRDRDLLVRLRTCGMPIAKITSRYGSIHDKRETINERLDLVEEQLGDPRLVANFLQSSAILTQESKFQPNLVEYKRMFDTVEEEDLCYEERLRNLERISKWGLLPAHTLESFVNTKIGIALGNRNPVVLAESSQYLKSIGFSPEDILRHPYLLLQSVKRLQDAVELIEETFGKKKIEEREYPLLLSTASKGCIPKREAVVIYDFVYRDLGESLGVSSRQVKAAVSSDEHSRIAISEFFRKNPFSVIDQLKNTVKLLREKGFSSDSILKSLFVVLIPPEDAERKMEAIFDEMDIGQHRPLEMNLQIKLLNLLQYRFEFYEKF